MKNKILCAFMLAILPLGLLCGCDESTNLKTQSTNQTCVNFHSGISLDLKNFSEDINAKIKTSLTQSAETATFDVGTFRTTDLSAYNSYTTSVWSFVNTTNACNMFATTAYQMLNDNSQNYQYFDVSFLANEKYGTLDSTDKYYLENFLIQKGEKNDSKQIYYHYLTGDESLSVNMPLQKASSEKNVDDADEVIKHLGNVIKFTAEKKANDSTNLTITPAFVMPSVNEVQSLMTEDITMNYDAVNQKITLSYEVNDGEETKQFSKVVEFVYEDGLYKKRVAKFDADERLIGSYYYTIGLSDEAQYNYVCEYDIYFDKETSFISCTQTRSGNKYYYSEYYVVESGEIVGRLHEKTGNTLCVVDLFINCDNKVGEIKMKYSTKNLTINKLMNEKELVNNFCDITDEEKTLVASQTNPDEIIKYTISNTGIATERAGK